MKRVDQWTSVLLILAGLAGIYWVVPRESVPGEPGEIAPADLPTFALWVIICCAGAQLVTALRKATADAPNPMDRFTALFLVASTVLLFAGLTGIFQFGYVAGGILLMLSISFLMRPLRSLWPWIILLSVLLPTGLYWLSWHVLRLSLP